MEYQDIFAHRGGAYHDAMLRHPDARNAEFTRLFTHDEPRAGQRVLDIPAGGGYLRRHLPPGVELVGLELTAGFGAGVPVLERMAPWNFGVFDHIVCLAALHHIDDQAAFLRGLLARLADGGTLHLADVAPDRGIARFLDGFVGRYTSTGHRGRYLPRDPQWFAAIGRVSRIEETSCPWTFEDEAQMVDFCGSLFGLVDCPAEALRDALHEHVGFRRVGHRTLLDWRLLYVDLQAG